MTKLGRHQLTPLVIVGAGGFGREVVSLVRDINAVLPTYDLLGFLDDGDVRRDLLERIGAAVIGDTSTLRETPASYVIGIGSGEVRRRIDALARSWGRTAASLVHPASTVGSDVDIEAGAIIAAGARLTTHVTVGRHAHVNLNATVGHDVVINAFATLFGGVHLSGGVVIEEEATLGTGSVVLPNVRIGARAAVGAGAIVGRDVAAGTTVVAPPARSTLGVNAMLGRQSLEREANALSLRPDGSTPAMQIKLVTRGDGKALADLLSRIDTTYFQPHPMIAEEGWRIAGLAGRDAYLIGMIEGEPVAYGMLRGWDEGYEEPSLGVGIRRDQERRGLGRAMMLALHEVARERGATRVRLRVHPLNRAAAALYRSLGYREAGSERGEILMLFDL